MSKIVKNSIIFVAIALTIGGCTKNEIDVASYPNKINNKVEIPDICRPQYNSAMPKVAVVDFTNNSTFGKAEISKTDSRRNSSAIIGAGISPVGFVAGGAAQTDKTSNTENRSVDSKLAQSFVGPIEEMVLNSGGATLLSRSDIEKVNTELKFQDSGLVDPATVAKFGKLFGAKYIITGSIDNVDQKYRDNSAVGNTAGLVGSRSDKDGVKLVGLLLQAGTSFSDGMLISTKATIKIIDVETGKIEFSKSLEGSTNIGKIPNPNFDQVVGGVKKAIMDALPSIAPDFATYFAVKGYVTQLKSKDKDIIAQVNIGRDFKVTENQIFQALNFESFIDPISAKESCDITMTNIKLKATQQITPTSTWTTVEDGDGRSLRIGQLVQKLY